MRYLILDRLDTKIITQEEYCSGYKHCKSKYNGTDNPECKKCIEDCENTLKEIADEVKP